MNKLYKSFENDGMSVEAMVCELSCSCSCMQSVCKCTDTSNYYGYTYLPEVRNVARNNTDASLENENYNMLAR